MKFYFGRPVTDVLDETLVRIDELEAEVRKLKNEPFVCPKGINERPTNAVSVMARFSGVICNGVGTEKAIIFVHGTECHVPMTAIEFIFPDAHAAWLEGLKQL